jgi:hypothetical protein
MTRLPQLLAPTMAMLFLVVTPAILLAQSSSYKSPAALDTAPSNDTAKIGTRAKPTADDEARGRLHGLGSVCDAVDPPCPTGCKEDLVNKICVEAR